MMWSFSLAFPVTVPYYVYGGTFYVTASTSNQLMLETSLKGCIWFSGDHRQGLLVTAAYQLGPLCQIQGVQ